MESRFAAAAVRIARAMEELSDEAAVDASCCDLARMYKEKLENRELHFWSQLPSELRHDIEFAKSLSLAKVYFLLVADMFEHLPLLRQDREMWERVIGEMPERHFVFDLMDRYATREIRSNYGLMVKASEKCHHVISLVDVSLYNERRFTEAVLSLNPCTALLNMPRDSTRLFPELVVQSFGPLGQSSDLTFHQTLVVAEKIAPEMWEERSTVLKWFDSGLPVVRYNHPGIPPPFSISRTDKDVFLRIAKHCREEFRRQSFADASPSLRGDKAFMVQVVEADPCLFVLASAALQRDFDVALTSFSASGESSKIYLRDSTSADRVQVVLMHRTRVRETLALHDTFCKTFLIGTAQTDDSATPLSLLNQGTETTVVYKRLIGEFVGVPTGKRLRLLRQARSNFRNETILSALSRR